MGAEIFRENVQMAGKSLNLHEFVKTQKSQNPGGTDPGPVSKVDQIEVLYITLQHWSQECVKIRGQFHGEN